MVKEVLTLSLGRCSDNGRSLIHRQQILAPSFHQIRVVPIESEAEQRLRCDVMIVRGAWVLAISLVNGRAHHARPSSLSGAGPAFAERVSSRVARLPHLL